MLSPFQRLTIGLCAAVAGLAIWAAAWWGERPIPPISLTPSPVRFQGTNALEYTRVLAQEFPGRVTGTPGARRAAEYLRSEFRKLGYQVESPTFSMWLHGERVQGENIIATWVGDTTETVAILAHYDGQLTSYQAAEDNASGVGVLLELARALRQGPRHRSLTLVATDAEEWGMIGAREMAGTLQSRHTIAVLSLDYLTAGPAPALEISCVGQFEGYTPLWLRQLLVASGRAHGARVAQATGTAEWIERALEISPQDQGPLLRAGIPAVNISTQSLDPEAVRARYHTVQDVFRDFDPAGFQMLGSTVEQAVAALDTLSLPAAGSVHDFQASSDRYLPGHLVGALQFCALLPLVIAGVLAARNFSREEIELRGWRFFAPISWVMVPCLAVLVLYLVTWLNILPRYELYPATPKDPFLYHLPILVILVLAVAAGVAWRQLRKFLARVEEPPTPFGVKKRILFLWLALVIVAAYLNNPYAMWLLLGVFGYSALLLVPPRGILSRAVNAALLAASAVPFAAMLYSFGHEIYLGWRITWYLVLQAAYGVWTPLAVALFLMSVVIAAQLFRIAVLGKPTNGRRKREGSGDLT